MVLSSSAIVPITWLLSCCNTSFIVTCTYFWIESEWRVPSESSVALSASRSCHLVSRLGTGYCRWPPAHLLSAAGSAEKPSAISWEKSVGSQTPLFKAEKAG